MAAVLASGECFLLPVQRIVRNLERGAFIFGGVFLTAAGIRGGGIDHGPFPFSESAADADRSPLRFDRCGSADDSV